MVQCDDGVVLGVDRGIGAEEKVLHFVEDEGFHLGMGGFELKDEVGCLGGDFLRSVTLVIRQSQRQSFYQFVD